MRQLADDIFMISVMPRSAVNLYLLGDVLIDAGLRSSGKKILKSLKGKAVNVHAITHAHPDHQGSSKFICESFGIPLYAGAGDVEAMESGDLSSIIPANLTSNLLNRLWAGPGHTVTKRLKEGDEIGAGFIAIETPGHSPGHLSFWRAKDRVLVAGDALRNLNYLTTAPQLGEPPLMFTMNPEKNRASIRKIAALKPKMLLFGHGRPLQDESQLAAFAEKI